ncbi:class I SAM-dependent methyltransferase [Pseudonocardia acidicola]|uniref:Class I SAM-dependent methyltransferase n=1 Tax=Pseudonocardia acidicola TaxID=2724939 RepID=A0ABX1SG54_9PSEU|nr:class I SAM-dependent methyltransferase [Pseudonocardia acidicola]NMI00540.1 class I SAM-dependent methyltransferase [Pseudonocardia acidicola]
MDEGPHGWGRPLYERVLAEVKPGARLLDLGCGTGTFARLAADRGVQVAGLDTDRYAVAAAAERVPEGEFRVGDAHDLAWPDAVFDVVAAVQLLAHVTNPLKVLREAARVAGPGGTVVATVWGREHECDVRVFGEALAGFLPPRSARRAPAGGPPLTEPDRLRKMAGLAGLEVTAVDEVTCAFRYADEDALLDPLLASDIGRAAAHRAGPSAVRGAVLQALAPYREPTGAYRLDNLLRVLTSRVPPPP